VFLPTEDVDECWSRIVHAVGNGKLCCTCKIGSTDNGMFVVCVYVNDSNDLATAYRARDELSALGFSGKLKFKQDIVTMLGITERNCPIGFGDVCKYTM
jgi:hypothetical protein